MKYAHPIAVPCFIVARLYFLTLIYPYSSMLLQLCEANYMIVTMPAMYSRSIELHSELNTVYIIHGKHYAKMGVI